MEEFIKSMNTLRLANKNKWYTFTGVISGRNITIKGFGTWLQVYRIDGINHAGLMGISVKEFKQALADGYTLGDI